MELLMSTIKHTPATSKEFAPVAKTPAKAIKAKPAKSAKPLIKKTIVPSKPAAKSDAKPAAKRTPIADKPTAGPMKLIKTKKPKLVRDSFTIPKEEYQVLGELKLRADRLVNPVKKTELIRAGIKALASMSDTEYLAAIKAVPVIKAGRPAHS